METTQVTARTARIDATNSVSDLMQEAAEWLSKLEHIQYMLGTGEDSEVILNQFRHDTTRPSDSHLEAALYRYAKLEAREMERAN